MGAVASLSSSTASPTFSPTASLSSSSRWTTVSDVEALVEVVVKSAKSQYANATVELVTEL